MKTYVPKRGEVTKQWLIIDAAGAPLGRVAVEAARLLRGKHKPQYTPYLDCGDNVIIVNAAQAVVTGTKATDKVYYRHSGYPGGLRDASYREVVEKHPTRAMTEAVVGMLPHNRLGRKLAKNLRVFEGAEHPHTSQNPIPHEVERRS